MVKLLIAGNIGTLLLRLSELGNSKWTRSRSACCTTYILCRLFATMYETPAFLDARGASEINIFLKARLETLALVSHFETEAFACIKAYSYFLQKSDLFLVSFTFWWTIIWADPRSIHLLEIEPFLWTATSILQIWLGQNCLLQSNGMRATSYSSLYPLK